MDLGFKWFVVELFIGVIVQSNGIGMSSSEDFQGLSVAKDFTCL